MRVSLSALWSCIDVTTIADILAQHEGREGPLLPILHDVQKEFGYISESAMLEIAQALNLTRAEVYGVVSFYHDFRKAVEKRPVIKLCRAEACKARGVEALVSLAESQTHVKVEAIYCLGLCSVGPAAMIGDTVHARLDADRFSALMAHL
jgi:formate dehydrogenase subunit gamma